MEQVVCTRDFKGIFSQKDNYLGGLIKSREDAASSPSAPVQSAQCSLEQFLRKIN